MIQSGTRTSPSARASLLGWLVVASAAAQSACGGADNPDMFAAPPSGGAGGNARDASADAVRDASADGSAGKAGAAGAAGQGSVDGGAGLGGNAGAAGDGSVGGSAGSGATAGTAGTAGSAGAPDAAGGSSAGGTDAGSDAPSDAPQLDAADAKDSAWPLWCLGDQDCAGNPAGPYCDLLTGKCGKCKTTDPSTCAIGTVCDPKTLTCVPTCTAGQYHCNCNQVMQCDVGPPPKWVPKSPALVCNPSSGQVCDEKTGTCKTPPIIGTTTPTGTYHQYAIFNQSGGVYKGGYDVDTHGTTIYVNRSGSNLDVYKVQLLDSDGDGLMEPNQHPSNPKSLGPVEQRVLTYVTTYTKSADGAPLGSASMAELFARHDRVFSLGPTHNGDITEFILATKTTNVVVHPTTSFGLSQMGYGDKDGIWYGSNEGNRRVYSFCPAAKAWVMEFNYPNLAGSHMDGIEVVVAPTTQVQYVYVSDMTSDFLAQYRRDGSGGWVQENLFKYADSTGSSVEGMGYGALNHFWATGGSTLYEIGGGDLADYTDPP